MAIDTATTPLEVMAHELLELELCRMEDVGMSASSSTALWVLSRLLKLVEETHDRPVEHLAPTIRSLVTEQSFTSDAGDCVIDARREAEVNRQVDLIVRVLEEVRMTALAQGRWSTHPATPQMFG